MGHVGRFNPPKNHDFIIDVFNKIYQKNNTAKLTKVVVGKTVGTNVEVISGLKEGTEVVTTGQINLTNGTKVKVVK